jgi:hypothetical protein
MRAPFFIRLSLAAVTAAALTAPIAGVSGQAAKEEFTATAINMNSGPSTGTVNIRIDRWSTDEERAALLGILKGEDNTRTTNQTLLRALQKMPSAGTIAAPGSLAWDLRFAQQGPLEKGRRIVVATDRPIGFWEARNQPRTMDYPFTVLELRLDGDDKGEGKMLAGTKLFIEPDSNTLVLEDYAQQPVRLNNIRPR